MLVRHGRGSLSGISPRVADLWPYPCNDAILYPWASFRKCFEVLSLSMFLSVSLSNDILKALCAAGRRVSAERRVGRVVMAAALCFAGCPESSTRRSRSTFPRISPPSRPASMPPTTATPCWLAPAPTAKPSIFRVRLSRSKVPPARPAPSSMGPTMPSWSPFRATKRAAAFSAALPFRMAARACR